MKPLSAVANPEALERAFAHGDVSVLSQLRQVEKAAVSEYLILQIDACPQCDLRVFSIMRRRKQSPEELKKSQNKLQGWTPPEPVVTNMIVPAQALDAVIAGGERHRS